MRVDRIKSKQNSNTYQSILLRHAIRVDGKTKHITVANLSGYPEEDINAIEWALKNKSDINNHQKFNFKRQIYKKYGAVYLLFQVAKSLGIEKALGYDHQGKLALLQVINQVIQQGSVLSKARTAAERATSEVLNIENKTNEDDLYDNLFWLCKNQDKIEKRLFKSTYLEKVSDIFLYDVTSSYFEGMHNELADWGYNRDKKQGKMQVVAGLLTDGNGNPIAIRLFKGNTLDFKTVSDQIKILAQDYSLKRVSFVGDRGMLKSKQIAELQSEDFNYITAITKPQIETLLKDNIIQLGMFDEEIKEVEHGGIRYIIKKNPVRAKEIQQNRIEKKLQIEKLLVAKNKYLSEHVRSKPSTAMKAINKKINKLKLSYWLDVEVDVSNPRILRLRENADSLSERMQLDGCYVIKSNLPNDVSSAMIHSRYKDLKYVEDAFRTMKTGLLELRPWFVRTEESTRGRALVVMLAYKISKYLREKWQNIDTTVEEGISLLDSLTLLKVIDNGKVKFLEVPQQSEKMEKLTSALGVIFPEILPYKEGNVYSRVKINKSI